MKVHFENTPAMDTSALAIVVLVFIHIIGLVLVCINGCYLVCTTDPRSITLTVDEFRRGFADPGKRRARRGRCSWAISGRMACNVVTLYACALVLLDLVLCLTCAFSEKCSSFEIYGLGLSAVLAITAAVYYKFTIVAILRTAASYFGVGNYAKIGLWDVFTLFEAMNFLMFWGSAAFMIVCGAVPGMASVVSWAWALLPFFISYAMLCIWIALYWKMRLSHVMVLSREQAVELIQQQREEAPFVQWTVRCGHKESTGRSSYFKELHKETRRHFFDQSYHWKTSASHAEPMPSPEATFPRRFTELHFLQRIIPGDPDVQWEIIKFRELFKNSHVGHDVRLRLEANNPACSSFLVGDPESKIPFVLGKYNCLKYHVLIGMLGLQLPLRLYRRFVIGQIECRITKEVFSPEERYVSNLEDCVLLVNV